MWYYSFAIFIITICWNTASQLISHFFLCHIIDFSKKYEILYARSLGKGILKTLSPAIEHNYKTKTKATKK